MAHSAGASTLSMGHMANVLPDYRPPTYDAHSYPQGLPMPSNTTRSAMYQYPPNLPFAGQTRPQYDSSFAQQYSDPFLQNHPSRAGFQNYAPSAGYPATHVQGQQQFSQQPYYQPQQQPPHNYSAPYTQPHPAYAGLNTTFNPYGHSYGSRNNPNQVPGPMRQSTGYFFGPSGQTGTEALFTGPVPASGSYPPVPDPGMPLAISMSMDSERGPG